ncbi:MAG: hypothetical protein ACFBWO_00650 [Paracoccaceae bacterium]
MSGSVEFDLMAYGDMVGAILLAGVWLGAIVRLCRRRRWSPLRPVVMVAIIAASALVMADGLLARAAGGPLGSLFWIGTFNLWMALFDLRMSMSLARRRALVVLEPEPVEPASA